MGFSFRSFFGKGGSGHGTAEAPANPVPPPMNMKVSGSPFQAASGESPFANSLMFKTHSNAEPLGQPVQAAPFNPFSPAGAGVAATLTVGDILPGLPADVSKNPELSSLQTIALPEAVLENALRGGRASIPIFELYRACPTLFQMPVSPHDPREVPLPPGKISHLLSVKTQQAASGNPIGSASAPVLPTKASPFGFGAHLAAAQQSSGMPPSIFGMGPGAPEVAAPSEPLYQPSPFSIATSQPDETFAGAPQGSHAPKAASPFSFPAPANAVSNSAPANPYFTAPAMTASSPFSFAQAPSAESHAPEPSSSGSAAPSPFATAGVTQPPAFLQENAESIFGQNGVIDEPAKAAPSMFGATGNTKIDPAIESSGGFLSGPASVPQQPATSPSASPAFGFGVPAEINPFFSAPVAEKETTTPLPPVPAMVPEIAKSLPAENASMPAVSPLTNPFARIQALAKSIEMSSTPTSAFTAPVKHEPPAFDGGFLSPEPTISPTEPEPVFGKTNTSIFENLGLPAMSAQDPVFEAASAIVAPAANEPEVIKLGLAASLKNCPTDDLGTSPEHIPSWVQFSLPVDPIRGQLATGRVTVPFSTILEGLEPEVRGIFAKARPALMVELATNEVFHALTCNTAPSAKPLDAMPTDLSDDAVMPAMDPFASLPKTEWKEATENKEAESRFWTDLPTAAIPSTLFTLAQPEAPAIEEPAAESMPVEMPHEHDKEIQEAVIIPANPATGKPEFTSVAPLPPRSAPAQVTPAHNNNETRRLMLAVLLGSSDVPDVGVFASLTRRLPGVSAVLCVHEDRVVAADGDETCEAERFLREAPMKMRMLPSLTALTGIEDTETLHIQSGQGEATFCLQGAVTFAVLHDPHRREPVLKEKITLLGRELAAMLRDNPPA